MNGQSTNVMFGATGATLPGWRFNDRLFPAVPISVAQILSSYYSSYYYRLLAGCGGWGGAG